MFGIRFGRGDIIFRAFFFGCLAAIHADMDTKVMYSFIA